MVEVELNDRAVEGLNQAARNGLALEIIKNIEGNSRLYNRITIKDNTGAVLREYRSMVNNDSDEKDDAGALK